VLNIVLTAELIKVKDQPQLWAERIEREMAGALTLQGEVACKVADTLALKLPPAGEARLANIRPAA
jgi:TolB-like protein